MNKKKHVLIINTGGTISMKRSPQGYSPCAGYIKQRLADMPELQDDEMPSYSLIEFDPIIDSANMTQHHWHQIAQSIVDNYQDYDGFLVLHGTDTMAYTASALSFLLEHLAKPVILTGSQIPLVEVRSDARDNIINALLLIQNHDIPEVCLLFNNHLFRGNRVKKINSHSFTAYASPNFPPLATIGINIDLQEQFVLKKSKQPLQLSPLTDSNILHFTLYPGIPNHLLKAIFQSPLQAAVLATYGIGNAPLDKSFIDTLKDACDRDIIIVNCTQCLHGNVNMDAYQAGKHLQAAGVISGHDMTAEAAITKLFYLFSKNHDIDAIRSLMQKELRGELTIN